jgi:hypothetical protein
MKVRFEDGPESLLVAEVGIQVERGETVEVPDEVGTKLVEQGWTASKSTPKKKETD